MSEEQEKQPLGQNLNTRQKLFVEEYLRDFNATQAAIRAGYSKDTARSIGQENLTKPAIAEYLTARKKQIFDNLEITPDRISREYARLAFFDPRKMFNEDGSSKMITELDDDTASAIAGMDVMEIYEGAGKDREFVGHLKKIKLSDRKAALDSLARIQAMFKDSLSINSTNKNISVTPINEMEDDLVAKEIRDMLKK